MRITIVTGAFFPVPTLMGGAVEKVWFALGQEFARQGHDVVQISRAHPQLPAHETIENVRHLRVPGFAQPRSGVWLKLLDLVYSLRVRRLLPEADILVTNTFWLPLLLRGRARGLLYVHVARFPKGQMRFYAHAARLQAVSNVIGDAIRAQAPRLAAKVRVIPNALPFAVPPQPEAARARTMLYVGRVHPEKGLDLILTALGQVSPTALAGWRLEIVGPHETHLGGGGEAFAAGLRAVAARGSIKVEWVGAVFDEAELIRRYQAAAIFIYPSVAETGEAMPLAPLEAMINGCAPLVSRLACFEDYIQDDETGFVFDHRGADAAAKVASRLETILRSNLDEITQIGAAARNRAREFAVEPVAQRYLADFATLLAKHPPQASR